MSHRIRLGSRAFAAALALSALSGCMATSSGDGTQSIETASIRSDGRTIDPSYTMPVEDIELSGADPMSEFTRQAANVAIADKKVYGAVVHLSKLYDADPRDKMIAYDYARHLRYIGALSEAERVLNDSRALHGEVPLLQLEMAKLQIARGRPEQALALLRPLREARPEDPSILQAEGVALDRAGRHPEAQEAYSAAMKSGRPSAALLNNAAMSHLLSGDPARAEELLREAQSAPGATSQIQQNLALTLTLQGRADEARMVAGEATPASVAEPALEYYQTIAAVSHAWSLAGGE